MSYTIAVTDYDFPDLSIESAVLDGAGEDLDTETDFELVTANAETPEDVIDAVPEADGLLVQYVEITEEVFDALDDLAVVGRYGIGVDNVDLDAAADRDVQVVNVPSYCEEEVAVHALSLVLSCLRKTSFYDREIKAGNWDWTDGQPIHRVSEQTIGFAGFGKIPERLTRMLDGFGADVIAHDPYRDEDELADHGVDAVEFDELLARSDAISIHAPLTDETRELFDEEAFETMHEDAIVVNTARGELIDTAALERALEDGELAGAGLDVMPEEPPDHRSLLERVDVVCTPHVAWYSEESMTDLRRTVTEDVVRVVAGEEPTNPVTDLD